MNHTKEPWYALQNKKWGNADYRISNKENDEWANFGQIAYANEANAKRIVACVNACAGITNEALEAGYIKHLEAENERLREANKHLKDLGILNEEEKQGRKQP